MVEAYSGLQLGAIHFDLSPTSLLLLREALKLAPFPSREPCWGLGLTVLDSIEKRYKKQRLRRIACRQIVFATQLFIAGQTTIALGPG